MDFGPGAEVVAGGDHTFMDMNSGREIIICILTWHVHIKFHAPKQAP